MSESRTPTKEAGHVDFIGGDTREATSPVQHDPLVKIVQVMQDKIGGAMEKNNERLHDLVDRMTKDMEATQALNVAKLANKDKDSRINALKTLLSIYPHGSVEWKNALQELEAYASIP